ncbi:MAG: nicotinate-nucleotide adenylyltransferase [Trueperaceae bacterium]|nr:nicotinate-nucleotide adenylyltransferase [Trueperaceae bacterium]MDZ7799454.1 nicotinate-nucleotide adenylyltransferase [Trueperaceae bacterium]
MRVGLFGGRFDPPHMGHLLMAEQAREALPLDEVWFLPAGDPPHKPADASPLDRLEMTRLAVQDHPAFRARADEIRRSGPSYAYDTVVDLQERHPEATFAYLIGADAWAEIETWHRAEALIRAVQMVVFPRRGTEAPPPPERFARAATKIETVPFGVSGTLVRSRVAAGRSLRYLVPDAVAAYLHTHGLYARHDPPEGS